MLRLAVDIGGTFTDTVLMDASGSVVASTKTLTTHDNPAAGASAGVARALTQAAVGIEQVTGFIHGTTLATNALIERRGARVVTITTDGFRDILEIAYERRYSQYDINIEKPDLLVSRDRAFTIRERMDASGKVLVELDERQLPALIDAIRHSGAEAIAICLLHAYANDAHEQRLRDAISIALPQVSISLSSAVSPEAREFDRLCTTIANAYIQPLMSEYLQHFEQRFQQAGLNCPILMMTAGGGMTTLETASRFPIRLVESGPAGGAVMAARVAHENHLDQVLSFDMGGTTAKLCLIDDGMPQTSRQFEIARAERFIKGSGMPVRIPVVKMIEIGAGGGSIAQVDRLGRLQVGPLSAGSEPGPAAFGRGGTAPTVTDADVVLGYLQSDEFAEGQFAVDRDRAASVLADAVGMPLALDTAGAADAISRIVDENMASAARMHAVESGKDLGARTMIAFGGNGPLHACRLARAAGVDRILIPPQPGVGSAVGFLHAPVSYDIVRSRYTLLSQLDPAVINRLFEGMQRQAEAVVRLGVPASAALTCSRTAFMRYHGQGHEIEIALPAQVLRVDDIKPLQQAFEQAYSKQFSRPVPGMAIEIMNWSVRVASSLQAGASLPASNAGSANPDTLASPQRLPRVNGAPPTTVDIYCEVTNHIRAATMFNRTMLACDQVIDGPALVIEPQTTTLIATDFRATVDARGNLWLQRRSRPSRDNAVEEQV